MILALGVVQDEVVIVVTLPHTDLPFPEPLSQLPQPPFTTVEVVAGVVVLVTTEVLLNLQSVMVEVATTSVHVALPETVQHGLVV